MWSSKRIYSIAIFLSLFVGSLKAQFGIGVAYGIDVYQFQKNPKASMDTIAFGQGSAIFNMNIGPKIFFGGKNIAGSIEALVGLAPFSMDIDEFKGMGAFYFPVMAAVNFRGLTTFSDKAGFGFGVAGGMQFTRTDLYFLKDDFQELDRSMYQTVFGQLNVGLGSKDMISYVFFRYGTGSDNASNLHVGVMLSQNLTRRSKEKRANTE